MEPLPFLCHPDRSEPEFPASLRWTGPRVRLSLKERRMMFDNATNFYRKFGVAEWRDLRFSYRLQATLSSQRKGEIDNSVWERELSFPSYIVISTGAYPNFLPRCPRQG